LEVLKSVLKIIFVLAGRGQTAAWVPAVSYHFSVVLLSLAKGRWPYEHGCVFWSVDE